jgi:uncharacterized protein YutE (UPF0331/DUF86 family)
MKNDLLVLLKDDWALLKLAQSQFNYSEKLCAHIIAETSEFDDPTLEHMEAYTARYARLLDMYIQKILKLLDRLEGYGDGTLRDVLNRCAKAGMILDADKLMRWRIFRNEIAHDYLPTSQRTIFFEVKEISVELLESIALTEDYIIRNGLINQL